MGWLEGLLTGYVDRHHEILDEQAKLEAESRQREAQIYRDLLNSPDDETYRMAATGLLSMTQTPRRKGGLAGWMGEMQKSPIYGRLSQYLQTPKWVPAGPRTPVQGQIPTAPGLAGSAAQPEEGPTEGTPLTPPQPSPSMPQPGGPPPTPQGALPFMQGGKPPWQSPFLPNAMPPPPPSPGTTQETLAQPAASIPELRAQQGTVPRFSSSATAFAPAPPPAPPPSDYFTPGGSLPVAAAKAITAPPPPPQQEAGSWQLPRSFPTAADTAALGTRGQLTGQWQAYYQAHLAEGMDDMAARAAATDDLTSMHMRGGGAQANQPMEFEIKRPDGTIERVLGWADKRTQRYVDVNGMPFPEGTNFTKAVPYSAVTGDVYYREALNNLNIHPGQVRGNPQIAQQVQAEATRLAQERAGGLTTARGTAAAANPLSSPQRINQMADWQAKYNAYKTPIRLMELYLREMASNYASLKKGDMVAWEPFRTAFVHVNEAGSVVMPSEFGRSGTIGSLYERLVGQVDQWMKGGGTLPPNLVDEMMRVASGQWEAVNTYDQNFRSQVEEALKDPALQGIRPEQIFGAPGTRYDPWETVRQQSAPRPQPTAPPTAQPGAQAPQPGAPQPQYDYDPKTKTYVPRK